MNTIRIFYIISILIFLFGCNKKDSEFDTFEDTLMSICFDDFIEPAINEFEDFPLGGCIQDYTEEIYLNPGHYKYPVFNPNNPNQIAFLGWEETWWSDRLNLYIFDFCTGQMNTVTENVFPRSIDWGVNDWLVFTNSDDAQIWKIKSNGDSLTQLTNSGFCYHPAWNESGQNFAYIEQINSSRQIIIAKPSGVKIDSISDGNSYTFRWHGDLITRVIHPSKKLLAYNTVNGFSSTLFENQESISLSSPFYFEQNNNILIASSSDKFFIDLDTGERDTIVNGFFNIRTGFNDIVEINDTTYFLNNRTILLDWYGCTQEFDLLLSLFNLEEQKEEIIILPE